MGGAVLPKLMGFLDERTRSVFQFYHANGLLRFHCGLYILVGETEEVESFASIRQPVNSETFASPNRLRYSRIVIL